MSEPPNVFLSYSWTTPDHEAWVLQLANDLSEGGVHPVLDKWDLREGEDPAQFMERMVNDPNIHKVILICDKKYKEKADARTGGAGTEAQIISPALYGIGEKKNTKFVAVLAEKDENGRGFVLPTMAVAFILTSVMNPSGPNASNSFYVGYLISPSTLDQQSDRALLSLKRPKAFSFKPRSRRGELLTQSEATNHFGPLRSENTCKHCPTG